MARHFISRKEAKSILNSAAEIGLTIPPGNMEVEEKKKNRCYYIDGKPCLFLTETLIPTLLTLNDLKPEARTVTVDDGAVPHIMRGANVFAQGIINLDPDISSGNTVFVRDSRKNYIAVGVATRSGPDIMNDRKGEAVKILHYPDDPLIQEFSS